MTESIDVEPKTFFFFSNVVGIIFLRTLKN